MTVITYGTDVAPHLQRQLMYRRLRMKRWEVLDERRYDPCADYHPYDWLAKASISQLLGWMVAVVFLQISDLVKSGR